jgi:hypothetical protein
MERELGMYCERYSQLSDLSDYKAYQAQLQKAQRSLKEYPALYETVEKALAALDQRRDELKQRESEKSIIAEINSMAESAGLADLYRYQVRLAELRDLSPQTEKLRQEKIGKIENHIRQFEQLEQELSQSLESASALDIVRQRKNYLLRNLDRVQGTPLYESLTAIKERLEQLEIFFERFGALDRMPDHSPEDLNILETQIMSLGAEFASWLGPAQVNLLMSKKQQLAETRQRKEQEAQRWLVDLANRYKTGASLDDLLRMAQTPHPFLSASDVEKLEQVKKRIQEAVEKDHLLKIESLFAELSPSARRECLRRLQEMVDKP